MKKQCLSKYPLKLEINKTTILTPVNDRFPAHASNLKVFKFGGFSEPKD